MEKKTAIVVINNKQFAVDSILAKDNAQRIDWFFRLVNNDTTIRHEEYVRVYDTVNDFVYHYNQECEHTHGFSLVTIEYTDKIDGTFIDSTQQSYRDKIIEQGNADVAEFISRISLCDNLQDVHNLVSKSGDMLFGNGHNVEEGFLDILYKSVIVTVSEQRDGGLKIGNGVEVLTNSGELVCVDDLNLLGADFVESQDSNGIYLQRPTTKHTEVKQEQETLRKEYDGEWLEHIASIWDEGHKTICVELSGEKYIINGIFTNEDVIIDVYIARTMELVDRYFEIGAQDTSMNEAQYYTDYFIRKVAKNSHMRDCWYLTDTQFKFLKEA